MARREPDTPELAAKRTDEERMVSQMIALWCRAHHSGAAGVGNALDHEQTADQTADTRQRPASAGNAGPTAPRIRLGLKTVELCPACTELHAYATARIAACPHMGTKTFCSACPTHCYRPAMRERIREVMRWSGPRMILYRPVAAIKHAIVTMQSKRASRSSG